MHFLFSRFAWASGGWVGRGGYYVLSCIVASVIYKETRYNATTRMHLPVTAAAALDA